MKPLSKRALAAFTEWGRLGGKHRRRALPPGLRRAIASRAARARWGTKEAPPSLQSVRLENPAWDDPVFLEEVLTEGDLSDWRELYRQIFDRPFGETAQALERVVASVTIYGAAPLWRGLLKNLQGGTDA